MNCIQCNSRFTSVIDSRQYESFKIKRRRQCANCKVRFTTFEIPEVNLAKYSKEERKKVKKSIVKTVKLALDMSVKEKE